jgi:arginyl-tRNA synthetase
MLPDIAHKKNKFNELRYDILIYGLGCSHHDYEKLLNFVIKVIVQ